MRVPDNQRIAYDEYVVYFTAVYYEGKVLCVQEWPAEGVGCSRILSIDEMSMEQREGAISKS
jgi:hypothetical protein